VPELQQSNESFPEFLSLNVQYSISSMLLLYYIGASHVHKKVMTDEVCKALFLLREASRGAESGKRLCIPFSIMIF